MHIPFISFHVISLIYFIFCLVHSYSCALRSVLYSLNSSNESFESVTLFCILMAECLFIFLWKEWKNVTRRIIDWSSFAMHTYIRCGIIKKQFKVIYLAWLLNSLTLSLIVHIVLFVWWLFSVVEYWNLNLRGYEWFLSGDCWLNTRVDEIWCVLLQIFFLFCSCFFEFYMNLLFFNFTRIYYFG